MLDFQCHYLSFFKLLFIRVAENNKPFRVYQCDLFFVAGIVELLDDFSRVALQPFLYLQVSMEADAIFKMTITAWFPLVKYTSNLDEHFSLKYI